MYRQLSLPYLEYSQDYFSRIRHLPYPVFLDSGKPASRYGRYDIISAAPQAILISRADQTTLIRDNEQQTLESLPFNALKALYAEASLSCPQPDDEAIAALPFCGGMLGYFSYDLGRTIEQMPELSQNDMTLPDMQAGIYSWAIIVDHEQQQSTLVCSPLCSEADANDIQKLLSVAAQETDQFRLTEPFTSNVTEQDYHQALTKIDDYIHAGDCYQVNFAQRFTATCEGDAWAAYQYLREHAPTPYSAFFDTPDGAILSLSPEQFLEVQDGKVTTKPIKGTRPRGSEAESDQALKDELADSEKDRAENLMIVDLLRNDISKVCDHGSVRVPKLFDIESYRNVHHLVSTITGKLNNQFSPIDLLEQSFPGGSITGAPKIRAMEIIEELEPNRRSIYCGSIGYLSFNGRLDSSITIRTLLCQDNRIHCWAGGGIVADSEISDEYQETYNKVNNLLRSLEATIQS